MNWGKSTSGPSEESYNHLLSGSPYYSYSFNDTNSFPSDFYDSNDETEVVGEKVNLDLDALKKLNSSKVEFICFFVVSMICDILNCGTIAVIFQPRKIRRVNYLIANLSFVCMMMSIVCTIYVGNRTSVLNLFKGAFPCRTMPYIRNVLVSVISLTVCAISYERIRFLKSNLGQLLTKRTLTAIWGISIVLMCPTILTRAYVHEPPDGPKCKRVNLFGKPELTILYEVFRFTLLHLSVCAYMIFELYKIRSKIRYLYLFRAVPKQNLLKKIQRVRFVYLFSISFILVWFPFGVIMSLVVLQHRILIPFQLIDLTVPVLITVYFYLMIVPIIVLLTNEDVSKLNFHFYCNTRANLLEEIVSKTNDHLSTPTNQHENETYAVTSFVNENPGFTSKIIYEENNTDLSSNNVFII